MQDERTARGPESSAASSVVSGAPRARPVAALKWITVLVGAALLVAAVVVVARDGALVRAALAAARAAPAWQVGLVLVLPLANWLLTSMVFWLLTRRVTGGERVGAMEMAALMGVATSLNALPLRPGLIGRVAYHHRVHGIAVRYSLLVMVQAMGMSLMLACAMVGLGWALSPVACAIGLGVLVVASISGRFVLPRSSADAVLALALRGVEMGVWALRYWLVFDVIGQPIDVQSAILIAAVSQIVSLLPIAVGLREWSVAMLSRATPIGLTADLLNRAVELVVGVPLGLVCGWWLWRRVQVRARASANVRQA